MADFRDSPNQTSARIDFYSEGNLHETLRELAMSTRKILLFSSNPLASGRLRVNEEEREIKEALQRASVREQFLVESVPATRYRDLNEEILRHSPQIVHFSGHGLGTEILEGENQNERKLLVETARTEEGGLVVEDESGQIRVVSAKALAALFKLFTGTVECVVLNACSSHVQAQAIAEYIPYVVGMGRAISDQAAIEFALAFYTALGEGRDYPWAFEFALAAIDIAGIPESDTPKLFRKPPPPKPIDDEQDDHPSQLEKDKKYKEIITRFIDGNIVPFLGPGINPDFYIELASSLIAELKKDSDENHSEKNPLADVIGLPCPFCLYLPRERPREKASSVPDGEVSLCPMLKGLKLDSTCPLFMEQTLATAIMNLRYISHYRKLQDPLKTFYSKLREIIRPLKNNNPNPIHQLFAKLPHQMLAQNYPKSQPGLPYPLIITTNYDNLLELAFDKAHQEYDVVYYIADGDEKGKFKHKGYRQKLVTIGVDCDSLPLPDMDEESSSQSCRPIILKLFGTLEDKFIITPDQMNYLSSSRTADLPPDALMKLLKGESQLSILFLGYSPSDPDLQLIFNRLWQDEKLEYSYLVHQSNPGQLEREIWEKRGVDLLSLDGSLEDFLISLQNGIEEKMLQNS
jgi:SIR2-like domain/CHAT domain